MFDKQTILISVVMLVTVSVLMSIFCSSDENSTKSHKSHKSHKLKHKYRKNIDANLKSSISKYQEHHEQHEQQEQQDQTKPEENDDGRVNICVHQFRCEVSHIDDSQKLLKIIENNNIAYPLRIRRATDILRPLDLMEPDMIAQRPEHVDMICHAIQTQHNISDDIAVQQIPKTMNEYILSCTDGVIDKMYQVHSEKKHKYAIEPYSLKNLSIENKKFLRRILYLQHKKLGSVKGTVDIGFFCHHPSVGFTNISNQIDENDVHNPLIIVGLSRSTSSLDPFIYDHDKQNQEVDPRNNMISYPYTEDNKSS